MKYQYYKDVATSLNINLKRTKEFLNMVIHDIRNPTNQIKFAIDQTLGSVEKALAKTEKLENVYMSYITQMRDSYKELQVQLMEQVKELREKKDEAEKAAVTLKKQSEANATDLRQELK